VGVSPDEKHTDPKPLGKGIRAARERLGLDQFELAKILGVMQSCVSDWETGNMKPRKERWAELARALRIRKAKIQAWWLAS
jgi:DNA-binding transcriptional regulator YiaG